MIAGARVASGGVAPSARAPHGLADNVVGGQAGVLLCEISDLDQSRAPESTCFGGHAAQSQGVVNKGDPVDNSRSRAFVTASDSSVVNPPTSSLFGVTRGVTRGVTHGVSHSHAGLLPASHAQL